MKTKIFALIFAITVGLALTACGGGSGSGSSSGPAATTPPASGDVTDMPSEAPVEIESDYSYIADKGYMIVGYTVYEPMNYTDEQGNFTGFDTELTKLVCERLGVEPRFVEIDWSTKEIELAAKNIDAIWNGLTITEERKLNMNLTVPYLQNAQVVVMKADTQYDDTSSLIGKAISAEMGSAGEAVVQEDENLSQAILIQKTKQTDCLMEVAAGTSDAAMIDLTLASAMIGPGTDYTGLEIKDTLAEEFYGVAFRVDSDVTAMVNEIFVELVNDGTLVELAEKYQLVLAL